VADVALADRIFAPHYARPLDRGCIAVTVPVRAAPAGDAPAVSELLRGESFAVVDAIGDWAWGFSRHDGYVGYVSSAALGAVLNPSHIVAMPAGLVFAAPDIKSPVIERLPMGARIAATGEDGNFLRTDEGFVHLRHLAPLAEIAPDAVTIAARLMGTPYRWGGRSGDGIDCSGLVQLALAFAGVIAPRDSDQQREALGVALTGDEPALRGDLVFLPGHVGFMADERDLLHANAFHFCVAREPLTDVLARQPEGKGIVARRRITQ
jgi:cell wall-associated NlpC family hydrolase